MSGNAGASNGGFSGKMRGPMGRATSQQAFGSVGRITGKDYSNPDGGQPSGGGGLSGGDSSMGGGGKEGGPGSGIITTGGATMAGVKTRRRGLSRFSSAPLGGAATTTLG